jgi:Mor family transcriptional regulator
MALKKIGVNPDEEINGTSKSAVATMHLMDSIGGIQFYLPKNHSLKRIINDVDMYMDSFKMTIRK